MLVNNLRSTARRGACRRAKRSHTTKSGEAKETEPPLQPPVKEAEAGGAGGKDGAKDEGGFPWKNAAKAGAVAVLVPATTAFQYRSNPSFREAVTDAEHVRAGRMGADAAARNSGAVLAAVAPALLLLVDGCRALDCDLEPEHVGLGALPGREQRRYERDGGPDAALGATVTLRSGRALVVRAVPASANMAQLQELVAAQHPEAAAAEEGAAAVVVDVVFAEEGEEPVPVEVAAALAGGGRAGGFLSAAAAPTPGNLSLGGTAGGGGGGGAAAGGRHAAGARSRAAKGAAARQKAGAGPTAAQLRGKLKQLRGRERALQAEMYSDVGRAIDDIEVDLARLVLQKDMCKRRLRENSRFLGLF
jgi:hypothetical protein